MLWRPTESVCLRVLLGSFIGADATGVMTATGATIGLMQVLRRSFTDASTDGADATDAAMEFQIWVPRPVSHFITLTNV